MSKIHGIVWPAPGNPVWIPASDPQHEKRLSVWVNLPGVKSSSINLNRLQGRLTHIASAKNKIEMSALSVSSTDKLLYFGNEEQPASTWINKRQSSIIQITFQLPPIKFVEGKRWSLYDLEISIRDRKLFKPSSVVLFDPSQLNHVLRFTVATDIHVSSRWDKIEKYILKQDIPEGRYECGDISRCQLLALKAPCRDCHFPWVNANKNFAAFIKKANRMADNGELDFIILAGDLIDYKYSQPSNVSGNEFEQTEWAYFEKLISGQLSFCERLRVPFFTTTGNHDYRLYPYRLETYGLRHCGVPDDANRKYLEETGELTGIKFRPSDLNAIRISTGENHSLDWYYRRMNPMDDYVFRIGKIAIIFLDSGHDAFCDWSHLLSFRGLRFLTGLPRALEHPSSNGLKSKQTAFLKRALSHCTLEDTVVLITHAPFFNSSKEMDPSFVKEKVVSMPIKVPLKKRETETVKEILDFEKKLNDVGLDFSTLYRNQLPVLRMLCLRSGQSVVISGHIHRNIEFSVDKRSGQVASSRYTERGGLNALLETHSLFLQAPALGHVERSFQEQAVPSYRYMLVEDGRIVRADLKPLEAPPYDRIYSFIRISRIQNEEMVEIIFDNAPHFDPGDSEVIHRVTMMLSSVNSSKPLNFGSMPIINLHPQDALIGSCREESNSGYCYVYLVKDINILRLYIRTRLPSCHIIFRVESLQEDTEGYNMISCMRHHRELKR